MKQIPKIVLAVTIVITATVLTELFLTLPSGGVSEQTGQVLGIFKRKPKKTPKKKTAPKKATLSPAPATPPSIPPHQGEGKKSKGADLSSLEREITILYKDGKTIGPEHYKRLKSELDSKAAAGADPAKIKKLKDMLETVNPAKVTSTKPYPSPQNAPCVSEEKFVFTADITDLNLISQISPPGFLNSRGELKTHSFIWIKDSGEVPVYSPIDAKLVSGVYYTEDGINQYILTFEINCNTEFKFDHVRNPIEAIRKALPTTPKGDTRGIPLVTPISFKAGDLIGTTTGTPQAHNWDFGMYDRSKKNLYANDPRAYGNDVHAVCPYDFYPVEKKSRYTGLFTGTGELCK